LIQFIEKIFLTKNKQYSFIQIDRIHWYNTNLKLIKLKRMHMGTNSLHPC